MQGRFYFLKSGKVGREHELHLAVKEACPGRLANEKTMLIGDDVLVGPYPWCGHGWTGLEGSVYV